MAEYINKAELIKACNYTVCYEDDEETFGISEARIDLMPTIDIVTCSECKYWKDSDGVYRRGNNAESKCRVNCEKVMRGDYFCADGERCNDGK